MSGVASGAASGAAAGSIAGPVGSVVGGLIGAAGAYFSGKSAAEYAKESQQKRYRWMVKDLKAAGLNPMLAVSQSPGSPPQPDFPNVGEAAVKGFSAVQQSKLMQAQIDASNASANKTLAESEAQGMSNQITKASPEYLDSIKVLGQYGEVTGPSAIANERAQSALKVVQEQGREAVHKADLAKLNVDLASGELSLQKVRNKYADQLGLIETRYRQALATAEQAKIPPLQAEAAFWQSMGAEGKLVQFLKMLFGKR